MNRHVHVLMVCLSLTMVVSLWIVGAHSAAAQTSQPNDPIAVVTAFNTAVSAQDLTGALALLDPDFLYVSGPGSALPTNLKKGEFPKGPPFQQVDQSNINLIDATTVEMDLTFSGDPIPQLPHPFMLHATFTVKNGLITRLQDHLSPQTAQDLAALAPPPAQLPKTGASDSNDGAVLLALGVVCALASVLMRRTALFQR
jgi:LPXTG-motif cell wall-anchored protein